jgi:UDP-N-acetylmuramate dehydrogenase
MKIVTDYVLATSFGISVQVKKYYELETKDDVVSYVDAQNGFSGPMIGGTSNMIFPESIPVVGRIVANTMEYEDRGEAGVLVLADAGVNWDMLVLDSCDRGYWGLQNLTAIPGMVGAAPIQNIGAYGAESKDTILWVEVYDTVEKAWKTLDKQECGFGYRTSIFKQNPGRYIVWRVCYQLSKTPPENPTAFAQGGFAVVGAGKDSLERLLSDMNDASVVITPRRIADTIADIRWSKLPNPAIVPNVGSCFENPIIETAIMEQLKERYPSMPVFPIPNDTHHQKTSAGWIISQIGMNGASVGGARSLDTMPLVFVNQGGATQADFVSLANQIAEKAKDQFGIVLSVEPIVVKSNQ